MVLDHVLHDREPEPRAARLAGPSSVHPIEALEDPGDVAAGDPDAGIADLQDTSSRPLDADFHSTPPPAGCIRIALSTRLRTSRARSSRAADAPRRGRVTSSSHPRRARRIPSAVPFLADRDSSRTSSSCSLPVSSRERSSRSDTIAGQADGFALDLHREPLRRGRANAALRRVSAAALIDAAGVFSSWEAFATKSLRTCRAVALGDVAHDEEVRRRLPGRDAAAWSHREDRSADLSASEITFPRLRDGGANPEWEESARVRGGVPRWCSRRCVREPRRAVPVEQEDTLLHRAQDQLLDGAILALDRVRSSRSRTVVADWSARSRRRSRIDRPSSAAMIPAPMTIPSKSQSVASIARSVGRTPARSRLDYVTDTSRSSSVFVTDAERGVRVGRSPPFTLEPPWVHPLFLRSPRRTTSGPEGRRAMHRFRNLVTGSSPLWPR